MFPFREVIGLALDFIDILGDNSDNSDNIQNGENDMISMSSTATQEKWGEVIRTAQREPVMVTSHGNETVVIIGAEEYRRLQLDALKAKVAIGMQQADRGEFSSASAEDIVSNGDKLSESS